MRYIPKKQNRNLPVSYKLSAINSRFARGFTVIEMVIVVTIFSIVSAVVLFNTRNFSNNVSLNNLTQDIALMIRSVQVESVSGRYVGTEFLEAPSYGLFFETGEDDRSFVHFADFNNNKIYDGMAAGCGDDPGNECLEIITLQEGYAIHCIEATVLDTGFGVTCSAELDKYSITFTRPESHPTNTSSSFGGLKMYGDTHIIVRNQNNETASIHLWPTGQVEVE